jgi:hypothetical protein
MDWLNGFGVELTAALADSRVWQSILTAFILGGVCLVLGTWATRRVGLLDRDAPAGETLGVGLGSGLLIFAACWAAVGSGGRSAFTPVAIAFVVALALGLRASRGGARDLLPGMRRSRVPMTRALIAGGAFVAVVGLIYGSTMAPSPRNGAQPVEFTDVAFYSSLALSLNSNGLESTSYPSGFDSIAGLPVQNWYHWGEIWIAAATVRLADLDPVLARHYVALPLTLLAAAALAGTLVRRMARTSSRRAFLFGAATLLVLSPLPLLPGALYGWWAVGLLFGISLYGMSVIPVLLGLCLVTGDDERLRSRASQVFAGASLTFLLATHIVVAVLAVIGVVGVFSVGMVTAALQRKRTRIPEAWRGLLAATVAVGVATLGWGVATGHGLGGVGTSASVAPFGRPWVEAIAFNTIAGGTFLAIPAAWWWTRTTSTRPAGVLLGVMGLVTAGAIAWGARFADFDMFHVFFAGVTVFAAPVAAAAVWMIWRRLRARGSVQLATILLIFCTVQLEFGLIPAVTRLQLFGAGSYAATPTDVLASIRALPADARLAYACMPDEGAPALISIYAHTGRRVVPLCFEVDTWSPMLGANQTSAPENPGFRVMPQYDLFKDRSTPPSPARIVAFMREQGIGYIYANADHPNVLVPQAVPIAQSGSASVLRVP